MTGHALTSPRFLPGLMAGAAGIIPLGGALLSNPVRAQESAPEEIVVVGQKTERGLQETPASVRVVTARDIEDENINDMYDVLERSVNVSGDIGSGFRIRGIDSFSVSGGGSSYLASVYSDGAVLPHRAQYRKAASRPGMCSRWKSCVGLSRPFRRPIPSPTRTWTSTRQRTNSPTRT